MFGKVVRMAKQLLVEGKMVHMAKHPQVVGKMFRQAKQCQVADDGFCDSCSDGRRVVFDHSEHKVEMSSRDHRQGTYPLRKKIG